VTDRWFSRGPAVSSTNKTDHHNITEIFLKVALNTIKPNQAILYYFDTHCLHIIYIIYLFTCHSLCLLLYLLFSSHSDDIDLFAGGILERMAPGAIVGPTFRCIIGRQLSACKTGDIFFYENNFPLTGFKKGTYYQIYRSPMIPWKLN